MVLASCIRSNLEDGLNEIDITGIKKTSGSDRILARSSFDPLSSDEPVALLLVHKPKLQWGKMH
jgi:hypothetical protein